MWCGRVNEIKREEGCKLERIGLNLADMRCVWGLESWFEVVVIGEGVLVIMAGE